MDNFAQIKSARKRCVSMGKFHGWRTEFNNHALAASIDNHTYCIDNEIDDENTDWLLILIYINKMAKSINEFCDKFKVAGDEASEYWLERFLYRCDIVCDASKL